MKETHEVEEILKRYLQYSEQVILSQIYRSPKPFQKLQRLLFYWNMRKHFYDADKYAQIALEIFLGGMKDGINFDSILSQIEIHRRIILQENIIADKELWQLSNQCYVYCSETKIKMRLLFTYYASNHNLKLLSGLRSDLKRNRTSHTIHFTSPEIGKESGRIISAA